MDYVRKRLPMAIAVAVTLTLTGLAALAQGGQQVTPAAVSNVNAHRVDGKHAVSSTQNLNQRKGKLMSFNSAGYLPANIVSGNVATLATLGSTTGAVNEVDNPVQWNQLQGVPLTVLAGDTTRSFIVGESAVLAPGGTSVFILDHPIGLEVETMLIPTAIGGLVIPGSTAAGDVPVVHHRTAAGTIREYHFFQVFGVATSVKLRATVWNDSYLSPAAAKGKVKVTFAKNPKKILKQFGIR
jgi:hypothetical protein